MVVRAGLKILSPVMGVSVRLRLGLQIKIEIMFFLGMYVGMCLVWSIVAMVKMGQYSIKPRWHQYLLSLLLNCVGFPFAITYALVNKRI